MSSERAPTRHRVRFLQTLKLPLLASGSFDSCVKLWDTRSGQDLRTLQGHTRWVYSVAFDPTDRGYRSLLGVLNFRVYLNQTLRQH